MISRCCEAPAARAKHVFHSGTWGMSQHSPGHTSWWLWAEVPAWLCPRWRQRTCLSGLAAAPLVVAPSGDSGRCSPRRRYPWVSGGLYLGCYREVLPVVFVLTVAGAQDPLTEWLIFRRVGAQATRETWWAAYHVGLPLPAPSPVTGEGVCAQPALLTFKNLVPGGGDPLAARNPTLCSASAEV